MIPRNLDAAHENVIDVGPADIWWDWKDGPRYTALIPGAGRTYGAAEQLDPTPAYPHDSQTVWNTLRDVRQTFPLPRDHTPTYFVLPLEFKSRTNAGANVVWLYDEPEVDGRRPWASVILMCAKRIPPHPAMTRYLVAHEYGHVVEDVIAERLGYDVHGKDHDKLLREYAAIRGLPDDLLMSASPGRWHDAVQEIFACDFRIMMAQQEVEFWPHAGIPKPHHNRAVIDWWMEQRQYAAGVADAAW